jgi:hypothetical protein
MSSHPVLAVDPVDVGVAASGRELVRAMVDQPAGQVSPSIYERPVRQ